MTTTTELEKLMDPVEAGALLGFHPRTMLRKAASGEIPALKISGEVRFRPSKLAEYIARKEAEGSKAA